jgi:hypothetical protein
MASTCPDPFIEESRFPSTGGGEFLVPNQETKVLHLHALRLLPFCSDKVWQLYPVDGAKISGAFPAVSHVPLAIGDGKMLIVRHKHDGRFLLTGS